MFDNVLAMARSGAIEKPNIQQMLLLEQYSQAEKALSVGQRAATPPVGPYGHGTNGLFNVPGLDPRVFGAMMYPDMSSLGDIPVTNSGYGNIENNQYGGYETNLMGIITGVTAGALDDPANQPTGDCAEGPEPGLTKLGVVANTYGRYRGSTRPISIVRAGMLRNAADPTTLRLMNSPDLMNRFWPSLPIPMQILLNEMSRRVFELVISFQRMFAAQIWIGNPANNSGERRYIWGLNSQINTSTHRDFQSSAVLTAADPYVYNFNYGIVNDGTSNIVRFLEDADFQVNYTARRQYLTPFTYKLRMRPELWHELTTAWPVKQYFEALTQINAFTNGRVVIDAATALDARNRMRESLTLPINGKFVQVVLDDSIPEDTPVTNAALTISGTYASDIYLTPSTVLGGIPALYFDYFDHNNANSMAIQNLVGVFNTFTSDGGLFRWYLTFSNGCFRLTFDVIVRLNLIASQLSARITNVAYRPLVHTRSMQPASAYFTDGGNTYQATPQPFYVGYQSTPTTGGTWPSVS